MLSEILDDRSQENRSSWCNVSGMTREPSRCAAGLIQAFSSDIFIFLLFFQIAESGVDHASQTSQFPCSDQIEFAMWSAAASEFLQFIFFAIAHIFTKLFIGSGYHLFRQSRLQYVGDGGTEGAQLGRFGRCQKTEKQIVEEAVQKGKTVGIDASFFSIMRDHLVLFHIDADDLGG